MLKRHNVGEQIFTSVEKAFLYYVDYEHDLSCITIYVQFRNNIFNRLNQKYKSFLSESRFLKKLIHKEQERTRRTISPIWINKKTLSDVAKIFICGLHTLFIPYISK